MSSDPHTRPSARDALRPTIAAARSAAPWVAAALFAFGFALSGVAPAQGSDAERERHVGPTVERDADVPALPFADNPDPELCGIPQPVLDADSAAIVTGVYDGELVMDPVLLYDSHLRRSVVGAVPSGHPVVLQLFQSNPELDYFQVRAEVEGETVRGWIPAPFVVRTPAGN